MINLYVILILKRKQKIAKQKEKNDKKREEKERQKKEKEELLKQKEEEANKKVDTVILFKTHVLKMDSSYGESSISCNISCENLVADKKERQCLLAYVVFYLCFTKLTKLQRLLMF